ncbi:MAG: tRNA lysidine(34) synthetase TilS [Prochlorothrix sp.]|nr:tRNA lysidine(34) synthetase TilS [Prochlorothrix sp.]
MVWTAHHDRLHQTLRSRSLLHPKQSVLLAISGGQDSLCLGQLFRDLQPKWGWRLGILHCDHRWRSDSEANAQQVQAQAQHWQIPCQVVAAPTPPRGEAAARTWRYGILTEIAQTQGYGAVVTGHTASDRAETLLHNLMRGSGADGLAALTWQRPLTPEIHLVRPLLNWLRSETAQFCQDHHLLVWDDSSNHDRRYSRNRIRLDLLPQLRSFNPQVDHHLAQTADLLQADVAYLESQAQTLRLQIQQGDRLHRSPLQGAPIALQRRVIRQFLQVHLPQSPTFAHIAKLVALITAPQKSQTDPFPGGAIAQVRGEWLVLMPQPSPQSRSGESPDQDP